jgi:hypothetical protein
MTEVSPRSNLPTFDFIMSPHADVWAAPVADHINSTPGVVAVAFEVLGTTPDIRTKPRHWPSGISGPGTALMEAVYGQLAQRYPLHYYDAEDGSPEYHSFIDAMSVMSSTGHILGDLGAMRSKLHQGLRGLVESDGMRDHASAEQLTGEIAPQYAHIPDAVISVYGGPAHEELESLVAARGYPTRLTVLGGGWSELPILRLLRQDRDAAVPQELLDRYLLTRVLGERGTLMPDGTAADLRADQVADDFVGALSDDAVLACLEGITAARRDLQNDAIEQRHRRGDTAIDRLLGSAATVGGVQLVTQKLSQYMVDYLLRPSNS